MENINSILDEFDFKGNLVDYNVYGSGHINTTYLVKYDDNGKTWKYIVQNINPNVFKDIEKLMDNVFSVTSYLRKGIREKGGDENRETLHFIKTKDGNKFYKTEDNHYYRAYIFVEDSVGYNQVESAEMFGQSGVAFGKFQKLLADFPADSLYETIPDFHNTEKRYKTEFLPAVENNLSGRKNTCLDEIEFVKAREEYCSRFVNMIAQGKLPLRVTHNDTKLNNVLFDEKTDKAICVIDLDTIMPGLALYDFGDSIRFGANTASEDEKDLSRVSVNLEYFEAYAKGFLSEVGSDFVQAEIDNLAFASILMTLECGMRFLTDYLNGDTYFKTAYPEHNLVRAKDQFALVADMERHLDEMEQIIKNLKY